MRELIFFLEERSAKAMLESLLPRMLNEDTRYRCIPFEGKQDLEKQIARKIRAYKNDNARFIVIRDQDSHPDYKLVKKRLLDLCKESGKVDKCLVRIACIELESFYLADLHAVEQALALEGLVKHQQTKKFRTPDKLGSPSKELRILTGQRYEKVSSSRAIGQYLSLENERSPSFRNLISGIRRMENELIHKKP